MNNKLPPVDLTDQVSLFSGHFDDSRRSKEHDRATLDSVMEAPDIEVLRAMLRFYVRPGGLLFDATSRDEKLSRSVLWSGPLRTATSADDPSIYGPHEVFPFEDETVAAILFRPRPLSTDSYRPFLREARRVLEQDGIIIATFMDPIERYVKQWEHVAWVVAVEACIGMTPCDCVIQHEVNGKPRRRPGRTRHYHARRQHSYWMVARKGKCTPKRRK